MSISRYALLINAIRLGRCNIAYANWFTLPTDGQTPKLRETIRPTRTFINSRGYYIFIQSQ